MVAGVILILAGIMIFIYPPLLSAIVGFILISIGISLVGMARYYRRQSRNFDDPFMRFFFRM
ncbi:MAG: hypothetical protein PHV17_09675 [Candidatus Omnitrophica bacterium]|nr:hypothetical protein [Candidatus Omnitrophota bacterium]